MTPAYVSDERKQAYMAQYQRVADTWPVPYTDRFIETPEGCTYARVSGPADAPPLLLLHGYSATSLMWRPNIAALSQHFRCYALDAIFDVGQSEQRAPMNGLAAHARWLANLLDELGAERARIAGLSWGGFEAANFASHFPDRVEKLVLLAPVAPLKWMSGVMTFKMFRAAFRPTQHNLDAMFEPMLAPGSSAPDDFRELMELGVGSFRSNPGVLPLPFSDDALRRITAPTLLLIGAHECFYNPQAAIDRARRHIANVEAEIVPDAGHFMVVEQPDLINHRMVEFLADA